jgi:ABC-type lipoprotein release transport system permease subunit
MTDILKLGWRNIWRNRRRTLISMSAIGVGLMLVVFYSGMVGGMLADAKNQLDNAGMGHIEIFARGYRPKRDVGTVMTDVPQWHENLALPVGAQVGTRSLARGLATSARGSEPVQVLGVDWSREKLLSAHLRQVTVGTLPAAGDDRGVVIGEQLAQRLALKVGSKLRVMVQRADSEMGADLYRVRGVFHSISPAIGQRQVYVSQAAARNLLGLGNAAHQVVIQLDDPMAADTLAPQLQAALGQRFEVRTWGELTPILKRMEALTNNVVFALALFVYLLVGLGVLNTMLMSVLERTREFGVLLSLGTRPARVIQVVLSESFWIGTLAVAFGALLGGLATWHFSRTGIRFLGASESIQMEGAIISSLIKTRFSLPEIAKAAIFVYLMALVVGLYPALRITRLQPAEALRRT